MSFAAYSTPDPETQYSAEYFAALTITDTHRIIQNNRLPAILPKGSIQNWCWSDTVPTAATDIIVTAADAVPCLEDLLPITQAAEDAFHENARSICVRIRGKTQRYHFSKIRLIVNINNHAYNLQAVSRILDRVVSSSLLLPDVIEEFKLCKFSEPLAGFCIARTTPLHMLGCLLDEQWVIEDVLNARAELTSTLSHTDLTAQISWNYASAFAMATFLLFLGADWKSFQTDFWASYRAVSPEDFDRQWRLLVARYPSARTYLHDLYQVRDRWAWAWVSVIFTAGIRTNGRVEAENRVTKYISGPKKNLFQVFTALNERTEEQSRDDLIRVREASRKQHPGQLETLFKPIMDLLVLREHVGPFALQTCVNQMKLSMFYDADALQLPDGIRNWSEYAIALNDSEPGYIWQNGEEQE
ncbi:hypothetical protein MVEN_00973500 [Mycena venus]|uniref:Uncharacterized protein n=1 Tax=Mycena venus TaxID=2733690 RepID=A0A8H7CZJ3_9AGAR|nr:hypothetical protein MVEN_00973500 [Mycena venus]